MAIAVVAAVASPAGLKAIADEFEAINARFAEPMEPEEMEAILRLTGDDSGK